MEERLNILGDNHPESDEYIKSCNELSQDISSGKIKMLDIVTALGSLLVHNYAERRAHGTHILSSLLQTLPKDYLKCEELHFLSQFYADRTKDNHQVIPPLLKGVLAISLMINMSEDSVQILLKAFFDNIPSQQQQVKDRFIIYNILKEFAQKFPKGVEQMGLEFVMGLISSVDGERDPRNLKFLFNWLPNILGHLKLSHLAEEMFEVISCYFPIDFRAPPSDSPDAVTREELSIGLKDCLCSVPEFGEWCIPLIIEKLDSTLQIAKVDSLQLLIQGSSVFDPTVLESHSIELFKALRRESIETRDDELQLKSLEAVTSIFRIYENSPGILENLLTETDSLINQLVVNDKVLDSVSRFLAAICRGSTTACRYITDKVLPLLLGALVAETKEVELLQALIEIGEAQAETFKAADEHLLETFFRVTVHKKSDVRTVAFVGLKKFARYLNDVQSERLLTLLGNHICEPNEKSVRSSMLNCLETVYSVKGKSVLEKVFDKRSNQIDNDRLILYLESSCRLILINDEAKSYLLPELVEQYLCTDKVRSMISLNHLESLLNNHDGTIFNILHNQLDLIGRTIDWILENSIYNDLVLLQRSAMMYSVLIGGLSLEEQKMVAEKWSGKILELCVKNERPPGPYIVLLEGLILRLRIEAFSESPKKILGTLLNWVNAEEYQLDVIRLMASIVNKCEDNELSDEHLSLSSITNSCTESVGLQACILLNIWMTKALILKGSSLVTQWIEKLIGLLNMNPTEVLKVFKLIMDDDCLYFNKYSYSNIKLFYKQRFFCEVLKRLGTDSPNHLRAIGELLGCSTLPLLRLYAKDIQRPLLMCLQQCEDPSALRGALSALLLLLQDKHVSLQQHTGALLKPLLKLATESSSMMVRADALRCIHQITEAFPLLNLLPHKSEVLAALIPCLDDRKRLVRHHAVNARSAWFIIDAPT